MSNQWDGLEIRPSMTSGYADCPLRGLAKAFPDIFKSFGFDLRPLINSLAAGIGTAVHAAAHYTLDAKMARGDMGYDQEANDAAIDSLRMSTADGFLPDDTSPNMNTAEQQVLRMTRCYRTMVAPKVNPTAVEVRMRADAGDGFFLSGQADVVAIAPGGIDDLKTGAAERVAVAQLGTYSLIYRAHGYEINWLRQTFIQRVRLSKPQPDPVEIPYEPALAERIAASRLERIKADVIQFCETGDPVVILSNPSSVLCSEKYCPLWGTKTCRQHKGAI